MKTHILALSALFLLLAPSQAHAGCPARLPVNVTVTVEACRFYDAAADDALRKQVEDYFHEGWDNKTPEELAARRAETLKRNTGLIFTGTAAGETAAHAFFLRTADAKSCDAFPPGAAYAFTEHGTCPMIFFEAPASRVLTFPASKAPE
jgi:hypothetical protein